MAAGTAPIFVAAPRHAVVQVSAANTNRDGSGTLATLYDPGANGALIDRVVIKAVGATTLGMIRLYVHDGSNARLLAEIPVPSTNPAGTEKTWEFEWVPPGGSLALQDAYTLRGSTHIAETFNAHVFAGDY